MIEIGDKKFRNLQEQVAYNATMVEKLDEKIEAFKRLHSVTTYYFDNGEYQVLNFNVKSEKQTPFTTVEDIKNAVATNGVAAIGHGFINSVSQTYYNLYLDGDDLTVDYVAADGSDEGFVILNIVSILDNVI